MQVSNKILIHSKDFTKWQFNLRDFAQIRLITEVKDLQGAFTSLHHKLEETEAQHQQLLKARSNLETDLKNKVNALYVDREKCMGLRRSFPVDSMIKY